VFLINLVVYNPVKPSTKKKKSEEKVNKLKEAKASLRLHGICASSGQSSTVNLQLISIDRSHNFVKGGLRADSYGFSSAARQSTSNSSRECSMPYLIDYVIIE